MANNQPTPAASKRLLGVEIECIVPHDNVDEVSRAVVSYARVGTDASIESNDEGEGLELSIGPAFGEDFEDRVRKVCSALAKNDAWINVSCGLHVHADAPEIALKGSTVVYSRFALGDVEAIDALNSQKTAKVIGGEGEGYAFAPLRSPARDLASGLPRIDYPYHVGVHKNYSYLLDNTHEALRFLAQADAFLRSFVVQSRRVGNAYCKPLSKVTATGGIPPQTLGELYRSVSERYCGINLQAVLKHGTIENRYHSGSLNAEKIIHWSRLWARLVDIALKAPQEAQTLENVISEKAKAEMLFALAALPPETETYLRERRRKLAATESGYVGRYIKVKKAAPVCAV